MGAYSEALIGIDIAKTKNATAVAEAGRDVEVRRFSEVGAADLNMRPIIQRVASKYEKARFCYETGATEYGLHRLIRSLGHDSIVVAPSGLSRKAGDRVKTNRRDAVSLTKLHRASELTAAWVPDEGHEAIRDLVPARAAAVAALCAPSPAGERIHAQARSHLAGRG